MRTTTDPTPADLDATWWRPEYDGPEYEPEDFAYDRELALAEQRAGA